MSAAYYDMVVGTARMMDAPDISWKTLLHALLRITQPMGVVIDEDKLKSAWREFKKAKRFIK